MTLNRKTIVGAAIGWIVLWVLPACSTFPENPAVATAADEKRSDAAETPLTPETDSRVSPPAEPDQTVRPANRPKQSPPVLINYFGGIDAANTGFLVRTILAEMADGQTDFHININSTGGDPNYAIAAYNLLKGLPVTITTYNVNQVESAAVYLYCVGKQRHAHPRSIFTIHSVKWSLTAYSPAKIADISKKINLQQTNITDIFKSCMNVTPAEIEQHLYGDEDWYLEAREAFRKGLANGATPEIRRPKKVYLISDGYKG